MNKERSEARAKLMRTSGGGEGRRRRRKCIGVLLLAHRYGVWSGGLREGFSTFRRFRRCCDQFVGQHNLPEKRATDGLRPADLEQICKNFR